MSKYTKPIPLDKLPETPAVYGEMIEEYNETKKTVSRDIEVEGLGKGRLVLSKQNKGKPFFYADEANIEANQKAAKQLQTAETIANAPLLLAPFFSIAKGGQRIIKQRRDNQIKKSVLGAQDLDKVNNVIDLVKSRATGIKPEIPSKTTAPTTSIMNAYKNTGITPQQKKILSNIVLQQGTNNIESYGFGPEGPRGGATDAQIMQAYRERTGELQLNPNLKQETTPPKQLELDLTQKSTTPPPMQMLTNQSRQLSTFFPWESTGVAQAPKANYGDVVDITSRRVQRNQRSAVRKNIKFKKVESIDLSNGFKPTKNHRNFEEYILDLLEADKIPAQNITPRGFQALGRGTTPDLELYEDYIAGYFNTYGTLEGITKVTLGGKGVKFKAKSLDNLPDVERILKAYKLNPKMFSSGAFNPNTKESKDIVQDFANSKGIDDYIVKNLKLQRHHIAILDDSFALVDGLTGNDLQRMYDIMDEEGLVVGNDPRNLQLLPQIMHQGFVHSTLWGMVGPEWTGVSQSAKIQKKNISRLPVEQRRQYVRQLKDSITELNLFMDDIIDSYIKEVKGVGNSITLQDKKDFNRYVEDYMDTRGIKDTFDVDETIRSTGKFGRPDLEDQDFGQGRMQDDLQ